VSRAGLTIALRIADRGLFLADGLGMSDAGAVATLAVDAFREVSWEYGGIFTVGVVFGQDGVSNCGRNMHR